MMRRIDGGVQFFDLVEVNWRSDRDNVAIAELSSGCTSGATGAMCIAGTIVGSRGVGVRHKGLVVGTERVTRDAKTIGISSAPRGLAAIPSAWGIMVPGI
jgi:hypothetical protein